MRVQTRGFRLQKAGNPAEDYEDAIFPPDTVDLECERFHCAVADGATETSFAGLWASLLVRGYARGELNGRGWMRRLAHLQEQWRDDIGTRPLPWYAEEKVRSGAFAALLGLCLSSAADDGPGRWSALAAGDSCLFQVRGDRLLTAFPLSRSSAFNSRPLLLGTGTTTTPVPSDICRRRQGAWIPGDRFYLMTDALAAYFLHCCEEGKAPWCGIDAVESDGQFERWIGFLRAGRTLRNDDVTLLILSLV